MHNFFRIRKYKKVGRKTMIIIYPNALQWPLFTFKCISSRAFFYIDESTCLIESDLRYYNFILFIYY